MADPFDETSVDEISMRAPLFKPKSFYGMEPFLAYMLLAIGVIMLFIMQRQLSIVLAVIIFAAGFPWLKSRGKYDLQWSSVLLRALVAQTYYPARSYINVKRPPFRKQQRIRRT